MWEMTRDIITLVLIPALGWVLLSLALDGDHAPQV